MPDDDKIFAKSKESTNSLIELLEWQGVCANIIVLCFWKRVFPEKMSM